MKVMEVKMTGIRNTITKVGITGAAGNIGITLTEGLADKYDLTLFYNQHEVKQIYQQKFRTIKANLSQKEEVKGIFEGLDAVIHLAADPSPASPWESILTNNIITTYNIFEEARRVSISRIIFASTNHVQHGQSMNDTPASLSPFYVRHRGYMRLSDPPAPDSYYGVSKLFGEDLGWYYWRMHGIQFVSLRIGATTQQDDPSIPGGPDGEDYLRAMFLSKRDCIEAFRRALQVDTDYLIAYAISDNDRRVFDMKETTEKLGYNPQDNAEDYFKKN
jgi:nucleoside-diphosphate-sugar epimerase